MSIKGWPTQEKDDRLSPQYATVEPVRQLQNALSVISHEFVREVGTDSVEASSTTTVINATSHAAQVGDVIRLTSGALSGQEVKVYSVSTNEITLAEELASAPALAVTFQILRHKYPVVEATGEIKVTGTFSEVATAADGGALPALTKVVSGYDGSNVQVIKTDASGELQVDVLSSALPAGAATAAKQPALGTAGTSSADVITVQGIASMTALKVDGSAVTQPVSASSLPLPTGAATEATLGDIKTGVQLIDDCVGTDGVAAPTKSFVIAGVTSGGTQQTIEVNASGHVNVADGGGSITVDATSLPLPTGASTDAKQPALGTAGTSSADVITVQGIASMTALKVDGSAVTQPVSAAALPLPTGAATSANQTTTNTSLSSIDGKFGSLGQKAMTGSAPVVIASDQSTLNITQAGRSVRNRARIDYTSTSVTTGAYVQLLLSTAGAVNEVEIFDSSGQTLVLATGLAASEVDQVYIFPGGNGRIPLAIAASIRVAIKAVSATASTGEISVNFYS